MTELTPLSRTTTSTELTKMMIEPLAAEGLIREVSKGLIVETEAGYSE
jgi:hypothetical protein